ncbi:HWE histidine kinase domain-containing protein [Bradyrhizobium sp.]|uniref:sensor histidine kinase n=1 Tax=Bradyrhizobium sp. TaxID=376 RepID=UPI0025C27477|nr:HWE histidine kinase domain-containing protein [Bradyrhizobium sp.]
MIPHLPSKERPFWRGQAIAVAAIATTLVCRAAVDPFINGDLYFTLLFPTVVAAGLFGGAWSAISTAFFGALLVAYFWIPPRFSFSFSNDGLVRLIAFWVVASTIIALTTFVHVVLDALVREQERAATIAREMRHRVQNSLTLIQAVARQTFRSTSDLREAQNMLMARLAALGHAQDLIDEVVDDDIDVEELVRTAVMPFEAHRFVMEGPPLRLSKDGAVSFALLIHELATNAAKYGALSNRSGIVEISWSQESLHRGCLKWQERFGPPVAQPSRAGFGTKLLRSAFPEGKGDTTVLFEPDGVRCTVYFPVRADGNDGGKTAPLGDTATVTQQLAAH